MKRSYILLVLFVLVAVSCANKKESFFVQISDPQFGFITKSGDFSPELELMHNAIDQVNKLNPEFVVFSGDLVHWRTDTSALTAFDSVCKEFAPNIKVYYLPGNHDVGNDACVNDVNAFIKRYGADRFVHNATDYTVIGYNSCVVKAANSAEQAEYEWLEKQLQSARENIPVIVVAHHPIFLETPTEVETYENFPVNLREKYINLFDKYGVDMYLAGHLHKCAAVKYNNIEFVISSALGRQLSNNRSGYTIVMVNNHKVKANYIELESIENSVDN